jgi:hypothetical protein
MTFDTQTSSKPRLKNDTLGEDTLKQLYAAFASMPDADFEELCVDTVQSGGGNQPTKNKIVESIRSTRNKATKLKKAQDFILAGMGLGV